MNDKQYNDLALLSKNEARKLLRIGNVNFNKLIKNGDIKVVQIGKREKVPYISIKNYISSIINKETFKRDITQINEEESMAAARKIVADVLKASKSK